MEKEKGCRYKTTALIIYSDIWARSIPRITSLGTEGRVIQRQKFCPDFGRLHKQTWNLSKILHRRIFRLKILHRQFHLILTALVRKNTNNEWKWRNLHRWQKFYTAAGTDGTDKFHLCTQVIRKSWCPKAVVGPQKMAFLLYPQQTWDHFKIQKSPKEIALRIKALNQEYRGQWLKIRWKDLPVSILKYFLPESIVHFPHQLLFILFKFLICKQISCCMI